MKSTAILTITVLVIGCFVCTQAATRPLSKSECKQIQMHPSIADNVVEELIRGVSGKIIEYYNWFFRPKSLTSGGSACELINSFCLAEEKYNYFLLHFSSPHFRSPDQETEERFDPADVRGRNSLFYDQVHHVPVIKECRNWNGNSDLECRVYCQQDSAVLQGRSRRRRRRRFWPWKGRSRSCAPNARRRVD